MKTLKTFLALIAMLLCSTFIFAHDFYVDGIYYIVTSSSDKTVAVTYKGYNYNSYSDEYYGSVTIPESVTYNGTTYSVTSIRGFAFYECGLTSIEIPNSVTSIGDEAFYNCSGLTSVIIPNSVTSIGDYAFFDCSGLTSVTIPNSVTSIGDNAFSYCSGLTSVTIGNSVTSIGDNAFSNCYGLTSVTIPNSVTSIGGDAFYSCSNLTSVTIGNSVTSIGGGAFSYCYDLTSVTIPNSVTSIGSSAFRNTPWYKNKPDGLVYINNVLYKYKGTMPSGTTVEIKEGTISISPSAFDGCSRLTSIEIPNSVTSIGNNAFCDCDGLTSVTIPNSVTSIGDFAFHFCSGLTSVTIGNSVTSIGEGAFYGCSGLTSITSYIPAEKLFTPQTNVFEKVDKTGCILYVPKGAKEKYATTDGWKDFMNIVEIIETYKVTFVVDGEVFATDSVTEGNSLDFPNVPEKEGYTFLGWSEAPETMPANDITITGEWSINSYLVTYIVDGEVYATDSVEYGAEIVLPEVPEKENSTFEWEEAPTTMPASDVTIYGNYVSGIGGITVSGKADVYTLNGMLYKRDVDLNKLNIELPKGVYIINGKKFMVR